jgi:hypothetical protein
MTNYRTVTIAGDDWIDPEAYLDLIGPLGGACNVVIDNYRKALRHYVASLEIIEGGTRRAAEAKTRWKAEATRLAERGWSSMQIFESIGDPGVFLSNATARELSDIFKSIAREREADLIRVFRTQTRHILEWSGKHGVRLAGFEAEKVTV